MAADEAKALLHKRLRVGADIVEHTAALGEIALRRVVGLQQDAAVEGDLSQAASHLVPRHQPAAGRAAVVFAGVDPPQPAACC